MSTIRALLILTILIIFCAGLTIGLTFLPCYSALCTEDFFPYETRIHIAFFYSLLASITAVLCARTISDTVRRLSRTYVTKAVLPIVGKRISIGGLSLLICTLLLTLATTGYWHDAEHSFWNMRGAAVQWTSPMLRIAWTGITGHWCDILLGLVILPISRNSLLGRLLQLHIDTLLFAHKLIAYGLLLFAAVHGGWYYSFVGAYAGETEGQRKETFNIDNPTLSISESSGWHYAVLPTGMGSWLLIVVMTVTALPVLRKRSYNTFYYTHLICSVVVFAATCVHASTDFYCLLPGMLLWVTDWVLRTSHALRCKVDAQVENAGNGWVRISLPKEAHRAKSLDTEKANVNPLQSYYINFPTISRTELHAFTATSASTSECGPTFLLQRSAGKKQKKLNKEWTWKLAALVPQTGVRKSLTVRVEGPYVPPVPKVYEARHILCIVGGTGITGALCLAKWWLDHRSQHGECTFRLVWTVRRREVAGLDEVHRMRQRMEEVGNATFALHVSSEAGRIESRSCIEGFMSASVNTEEPKSGRTTGKTGPMWIYCSGPEGLLAAAEMACIRAQTGLRAQHQKRGVGTKGLDTLDWYIARWAL